MQRVCQSLAWALAVVVFASSPSAAVAGPLVSIPAGMVAAPVPPPPRLPTDQPPVPGEMNAPEETSPPAETTPADQAPAGTQPVETSTPPPVAPRQPVDDARPSPRAEPQAPAPETIATPLAPIGEPAPARDPLAIGLMVTGGLLIGGGATLLGLGSTLEPRAEEAFARRPVEADEDYWQTYVDTERQRGIVFMAMGGVFAGAGAGLITWGAIRYVRHRRAQQRAALSWSPLRGGGGFTLRGRF